MRMQCWIYATVVAGEEECIIKCAELRESLNSLLEAGIVLGWAASSLLTQDDYQEKDIDPEWVEPVTHGALPAISLNVTYDLDRHQPNNTEVNAILSQTGFEYVGKDGPVEW
jgi:hypothetical protein